MREVGLYLGIRQKKGFAKKQPEDNKFGGFANRIYHEVQLDQLKKFLNRYPNFRYPNPISYIRDWSWAPKNTGNYNIDNFWCQKPVSYIGCWSFSYIGDGSRALKSSANICYSNRI